MNASKPFDLLLSLPPNMCRHLAECEPAVAARAFETRYYNADIHVAALAQPEFFRNRFGSEPYDQTSAPSRGVAPSHDR